MPVDLAIVIVAFASTIVGIVLFCWMIANYHSNRIAFWIGRTAIFGSGLILAWAIYSLIAGGSQ